MSRSCSDRQSSLEYCGRCCTKIKDLSVVKGKKTIIKDINIHMHCGELTALIGPNGGGKSTLLKAIIEENPSQGEIIFHDGRSKKRKKPRVGYVPQRWDFDLGAPVSVEDLFLIRHKRRPVWFFSPDRQKADTKKCLSRVQAEHLIKRRVGQLSGGEMQRVLLALALEPVPEMLLLDEPFSGMDYRGRELFYEIVSNIRKEYDLTILMVSHDLNFLWSIADKIIFLQKTIICQGSPEEVLKNQSVIQTFGQIIPYDHTYLTVLKKPEKG